MKSGVPEERIGLIHSYQHDPSHRLPDGSLPQGYASEPTTEDNDDRQIMLVTHQRVRGGQASLSRFRTYRGEPRQLMIYDESLFVSDSKAMRVVDAKRSQGWLTAAESQDPAEVEAVRWIRSTLSLIDDTMGRSQENDGLFEPTALPKIPEGKHEAYLGALRVHADGPMDPLTWLGPV